MSDWQVVVQRIGAMFLVICVGWIARRRNYLAAEITGILSRLVVDVAFPALVLTQMLHTVDRAALRENWLCPILGGVLILSAYLFALPVAPLFSSKQDRHTFLFLVAIPNWIFLPLPIAEGLYGDAGVRATLLYNVGAQIVLWTFGVWVLSGGGAIGEATRHLLRNAGLWATGIGLVLALAFPDLRGMETETPHRMTALRLFESVVIKALAMVGSLTIPMSLLAIGAQLGGLQTPLHRLSRALCGVLTVRLILAPLMTLALVYALSLLNINLPAIPRMVGLLIATMPVAISCSVMAERFGGDFALAAQGIFYSTFASLFTVPLVFYLAQRMGF
jgi:malate permease and related proteins